MKTHKKLIITICIFASLGLSHVALTCPCKETPITPPVITSPQDGATVFAGGKYTASCTAASDKDCDGSKKVTDPVTHTWSGDGSFNPTTGTSVTWTAPTTTGSATITVTADDSGTPHNDPPVSDSVTVTVQDIIYVDKDATGNNNGTSWANAFTDLQDALDVASSYSEIWVADGTYIPDDPDVFFGSNGARIYGGFAGTETARSQRDWTTNETILSGDMGTLGDDSDNSPTVLFVDGDIIVVDGFTITGGRSNTSETAGALLMSDGGGSVTVTHCVFADNNSIPDGWGGALYAYAGDAEVSNCVFVDNAAKWGGAVISVMLDTTFINCTFNGNHATDGGGAVYSLCANAAITNCILWGDTADANDATSEEIFCEFFGSATVTYTDIEAGWMGTGNINSDPDFVDDTDPDGNDDQFMTSDDGLDLDSNSPCIDAANAAVAPDDDICGRPRDEDPDMGAYEYQN